MSMPRAKTPLPTAPPRSRGRRQHISARHLCQVAMVLALVATICSACVPAAPSPARSDPAATRPLAATVPTRTLVMAIRVEPLYLSSKALLSAGLLLTTMLRLFNAGLALRDDRGEPRPYLAEALPEINTPSWQVAPDGRMTTTYRLRPGLTWHDGAPLTAQDFVFAWQVYTTPGLGVSTALPQNLMDEVVAPDAQTVVIHWRRTYPDAGMLEHSAFPPLPRHLLERSFQQDPAESFTRLAFWRQEYVGAGPFRLDRWEPGAFLEAVPFDRHAIGRPAIPKIKVQFMSDSNAVLASLRAGEVHLAEDGALRFQHGAELRRTWPPISRDSYNIPAQSEAHRAQLEAERASRQCEGCRGTVLLDPRQIRFLQAQLHPEFASPAAIRDLRVRQALAHTLDRPGLLEGLLDGEGEAAHTLLSPQVAYFADVNRTIQRYPFDPRRAEQLMADAGFTRGTDGFYANASGRFSPEVRNTDSAQNVAEMSIVAAGWRQLGIDAQEMVLPAAQAQDSRTRATYRSLQGTQVAADESVARIHTLANMPTPENRWQGSNRSFWTATEYESLYAAFNGSLLTTERSQHLARMMQLLSDELPALPLYYNYQVTAFLLGLHTMDKWEIGLVSPNSELAWNVHRWVWGF